MSYWRKLGGDEAIPQESMINPEALKTIWDDCFLASIDSSGRYKYDYLGKNLIEAYGENHKKDDAETLVSLNSHPLVKKFEEVIKTGKPLENEGEFCNASRMQIKYRQLLLPFADRKGVVKFILGGMRWRAF